MEIQHKLSKLCPSTVCDYFWPRSTDNDKPVLGGLTENSKSCVQPQVLLHRPAAITILIRGAIIAVIPTGAPAGIPMGICVRIPTGIPVASTLSIRRPINAATAMSLQRSDT